MDLHIEVFLLDVEEYTEIDTFTVAIVAAMLASSVRGHLTDDESDEYSVEAACEVYANDEITLDEYERRVELAVDPEVKKIRTAVEPIPNVGSKTSRQLARAFDSLDELRDADRETLEDLHGVGESTAEAIRERLNGSRSP